MKSSYIPSLDGIRAIAVFVVFLSHAMPFIPGMLGVTTFFFLSGFLITTLLRLEVCSTNRVDFSGFYIRRSLRILPPLYALLLFSGALQLLGTLGTFHLGALGAESLFFTNYWMILGRPGLAPGLDVLWSLAVEEHFYLLFPLLYLAIARRFNPRQQATLLSLICCLILVWRLTLHFGLHATVLRTRLGSDTRIDSILFGSVMAIIANPVTGDRLSGAIRRNLGWLLPGSVAVLLFDTLWHNDGFRETVRYTLDGAALFACFTFAITAKGSAGFKILNWKPIRYFGRTSYDFYLVHHVIIDIVAAHVHQIRGLSIPLSFLVATAVSSLSYSIIDRPLARIRSSYALRSKKPQCS